MTALLFLLAAAPQDEPPGPLAARVGQEAIYVAEVDRELARRTTDRPHSEDEKLALRRQMLEQLVGRRLILHFLARTGQGASSQDIDLAIARIQKQLAQEGKTLAEYLEQAGLSDEDFRRTLAWQIGWERYLEQYLTDENLARFFERRRREFDGTQLEVAQILLAVEPRDDMAALEKALEAARRLKQRIKAGEISFSDAARQHSAAPSAEAGGNIGLIGRRGPMPEAFTAAAFGLEKGQVSEPVVSPFGVHLILLVGEKSGDKTWKDVRQELAVAVAVYLFDWVAGKEREEVEIEYTGAIPGK